jgi:hypothetical protein
MPDKRDKRLVREGEPSQRTEKGLEIPVPTREDFFGALKKAAKKKPPGEEPSRPDQGRP